MQEVSFYQLKRHSVEKALLRLLEKAVAGGKRAVVRAASAEEAEALDTALWAVDQDSFLPHGTKSTKSWETQPVFLTDTEDNPNKADFVFVLPGAPAGELEAFERIFFIFEGDAEAQVEAARERWKAFKGKGGKLSYWTQTDSGKWEQKQG